MRTEAPSPIDTSRGISRRDFLKMGAGAAGLVAILAALGALDPLHLFRKPIPPNFFSNETDEGLMGDENSMTLSFQRAEQELFPRLIEEDEKRHMIKILFPFQAPENKKIEYSVTQEGNIRKPTLILPKNTKFIVPFDARFYTLIVKDGQDPVNGIALIRNFPDLNTTYIFYIWGKFNLIPNLQKFNKIVNKDRWKEFPKIGRGMSIMTTGGQTSVSMYAEALRGEDLGMHKDQETGEWVYNVSRRSLGVEFVTKVYRDEDGNNNEKLIVIGDK